MPNYPGVANAVVPAFTQPAFLPTQILPGDSAFLFGVKAAADKAIPLSDMNVAGETPTPPQASVAIGIGVGAGMNNAPPMVTFEFRFSGAPGAFNIQIQEADTDADGNYITPAAAAYTITAVNANNVARVDLSPTGGKFMRVLLSTRTNAVSLIAKASRLA